jgi:hypothetical protein
MLDHPEVTRLTAEMGYPEVAFIDLPPEDTFDKEDEWYCGFRIDDFGLKT